MRLQSFSFYGMKGILIIFMTSTDANGAEDFMLPMRPRRTTTCHHSGVLHAHTGALLADYFLGKYKTIHVA